MCMQEISAKFWGYIMFWTILKVKNVALSLSPLEWAWIWVYNAHFLLRKHVNMQTAHHWKMMQWNSAMWYKKIEQKMSIFPTCHREHFVTQQTRSAISNRRTLISQDQCSILPSGSYGCVATILITFLGNLCLCWFFCCFSSSLFSDSPGVPHCWMSFDMVPANVSGRVGGSQENHEKSW